MTFGQWLRVELEAASMKPIELAERVGCSKSHISQLLRDIPNAAGKISRPKVELVDAIADALGASRRSARLAAGYAPPPSSLPPQNPLMEAIERRLRRIPPDKRERISELVLADIDKYAAIL